MTYTCTLHTTQHIIRYIAHVISSTCYIKHMKDKYMHIIHTACALCTSFISYVLCECLYVLFLTPGTSCYKHCTLCYIIQFEREQDH